MGFSIEHFEENGFSIIALIDENGAEAHVIPSFGALLHAFIVPHGDGKLNVIDSYKNVGELNAGITGSFKSVKLSPFACRIKDAQYNWQGKAYTMQKSPIHGLLYDEAFAITKEEVNDSYAEIELEYHYAGGDPGFPFPYSCEVKYRLLPDQRLQVTTAILNRYSAPIPLMDGWHPYFTTGTPVDQLELQFWSKEIVEFDDKLIPTGKVLPYEDYRESKSLNGVSLDNSFLLDFNRPAPLCTLKDPVKGVQIEFFPDDAYPVLQVYTPPHRNSIAIENLTGAPNAFNNGMGLVTLEAGESMLFTTAIRVK